MIFKHETSRIFYEDENGRVLAEITFPSEMEAVANITHTYVDDSLRGQGIAGKMMEMAIEQIKSEGKTPKFTCSYAVKWAEQNYK
ncbi:GNAT family N-acetyltransferase [Aminipila terrae]|uniref:GNAT family N-acetyltransferase n=1 Tax=Aminipila terrae TaxID=2697030 RepID=A0A6P1MF24_9FIRM|nr:GNAT family N-acetyltransferase [Aminipila terrae]QHI72622.1 GNAT family N-acetyltransferase [Aminipila terrae]